MKLDLQMVWTGTNEQEEHIDNNWSRLFDSETAGLVEVRKSSL